MSCSFLWKANNPTSVEPSASLKAGVHLPEASLKIGVVLFGGQARGGHNTLTDYKDEILKDVKESFIELVSIGMPTTMTLVSGTPKLRLYDMDFGWGKPKKLDEMEDHGGHNSEIEGSDENFSYYFYFDKRIKVTGDLCVTFYERNIVSRLFYACFNTAFIEDNLLKVSITELDKVGNKAKSIVGPEFRVELNQKWATGLDKLKHAKHLCVRFIY
ncbi:calcium/lipid-binding (CaLB) phosphatase [Artemisia annua]|uniref:Calcium/lipid-binding (CaLB) phosphatase n=1 Tax=Artemisia annua TaxID=35608 RepID=A0A2U1KZ52_ARTAN|nr:calcium/lipid-binding (CaLB) phosphatase [Artemisia annua]